MLVISSCSEVDDATPYVVLEKTQATGDAFEQSFDYYESNNHVDDEYYSDNSISLKVINQIIIEEMGEFIFKLYYHMELQNEHSSIKVPVVQTVIISNKYEKIIQAMDLSGKNAQLGLDYFIDANFDGFLDFKLIRPLIQPSLLRWGIGWVYYYFLWNNETKQFILNEQLIELEEYGFFRANEDFRTKGEILEPGNSNIIFDDELQLLIFNSSLSGSWFYFPPLERHLPHWHISQYYQYIDGQFILIRIRELLFDWEETWQIRDLDVISGIETITYERIEWR